MEEDGFVVVSQPTTPNGKDPKDPCTPRAPLSREQWESMFDADGRIIQESRLRKIVFNGGIDADVRREVWEFLLGYFPFQTTHLERDIIRRQQRIEYFALKSRWKSVLDPTSSGESAANLDDEEDQQMAYMKLQAMMNAMRQPIDEKEATSILRIIKKDVPRTDRKVEYFFGDDNIHLTWLHDILVTYAVFHVDIGYAQGMNDLLAMILYVMDDEADAYSCFCGYMNAIRQEFAADGMVLQLTQLSQLLALTDAELGAHLIAIEAGDLVFCHRWLLLSFKREFSFLDSLCVFEILSTHHLELNSIEADRTRQDEKRRACELTLGAEAASTGDALWWTQHEYKFGFFICLAILKTHRAAFLKCADVASVYALVNSFVEKMVLADILGTAEQIFFDFCRMSARKLEPAVASPMQSP